MLFRALLVQLRQHVHWSLNPGNRAGTDAGTAGTTLCIVCFRENWQTGSLVRPASLEDNSSSTTSSSGVVALLCDSLGTFDRPVGKSVECGRFFTLNFDDSSIIYYYY